MRWKDVTGLYAATGRSYKEYLDRSSDWSYGSNMEEANPMESNRAWRNGLDVTDSRQISEIGSFEFPMEHDTTVVSSSGTGLGLTRMMRTWLWVWIGTGLELEGS